MDSYLTVSETAKYLDTSERFVRRLIAERRIAFHHVGRHVQVSLSDVQAWLATPTRGAASGRRPDPWCMAAGVMTGKQNGKSRRRFGRVRQLPSKRWQARYPGPDGQLRTVPTTFVRRSDAERFLSEVETDIARGEWFALLAGRMPLGQYARRWIEERVLSCWCPHFRGNRLPHERRPMASSHRCRPSPRTTTSRDRGRVGSVDCMRGC